MRTLLERLGIRREGAKAILFSMAALLLIFWGVAPTRAEAGKSTGQNLIENGSTCNTGTTCNPVGSTGPTGGTSGIALPLTLPNGVGAGVPVIGFVSNNPRLGTTNATLTSSDPNTVWVPSSKVELGAFITLTGNVSSPTSATVTASQIGWQNNGVATVQVTPGVPTLSFSPDPVVIGMSSVTGTITLPGVYPVDTVFNLSSSDTGATAPSKVTVPAFATSATFPVTIALTAGFDGVVFTCSLGGTVLSGNVLVTRPGRTSVIGMWMNQTALLGGQQAEMTIEVPTAPTSDTTINLSADQPSLIGLPATVVMPAGKTTVNLSFTTQPVASNEAIAISSSMTTASGVMAVGITFLVLTPPITLGVSGVTFTPNSVEGGNSATGVVTLNVPAPPGGLGVSLTSTSEDVSIPTSVVVNAGARYATFVAGTGATGSPFTATITASGGSATATGQLTVNPTGVFSLSLSPSTVAGGNTSYGTVTLNSPAAGQGTVVNLNSSNKKVAVVVPTVTVPAGRLSGTFSVTGEGVDSMSTATISAVTVGTPQTATLTVVPASLQQLLLSPSSILSGGTSAGSVALNGIAGPSGVVVTLSSNNSIATVPQTVTIPANVSAASFTVTAGSTTSKVVVKISGMANGVTQSANLTVGPPIMSSLTLSPSSVVGGSASTGTVTLYAPAVSGGQVIDLSSSDPSTTVPPSFTIASGQGSGTFQATTVAVASPVTVTIQATVGAGSLTSQLTVNPASVSSVTLSPTTVVGGANSTGTVTLNAVADRRGEIVNLSSSSPAASVPSTMTIVEGQKTGTFTLTTSGVNSQTSATISAVTVGSAKSATLTINAPTLSNVILSPTSVVAGATSQGIVNFTGLAGTTPVTVNLSSNNAAATLPSTVSVAAGSSSATFTVTTSAVSSQTVATITASFGGTSKSAALTIVPILVSSLSFSPSSVQGGNTSTGTVTVSVPATSSGVQVSLSSGSAAVTVPASVTVPNGQTTATFTATTSGVSTQTAVPVKASLNGSSASGVLTVQPATLAGLIVSPISVLGGNSSTGTVTLIGPAGPLGNTVALQSNSASATVPGTVTVPAGQTSATFQVRTIGVNAQTAATITATWNGAALSTNLTITPCLLSGLAVNPSSVSGGGTATGTVTLNGPAAPGGSVVSLSSNSAAAFGPVSIVVPGGQTNTTFTVDTSPVAVLTGATLFASRLGGTIQATVTVLPSTLVSLSLSPATVPGGSASTGTVSLAGPAPQGGVIVALSSSNTVAGVPGSVTILGGQTTTNFPIATKSVVKATSATIKASANGASVSAVLTVNVLSVASLTVSPSSVVGGNSAAGTVTMNDSVPGSGIEVSLGSNSADAAVPKYVLVSGGQISANFAIQTKAVATQVAATLTASLPLGSVTAALTLTPPSLLSVTLSPASVKGGSSSTGTVTISAPAPSGGMSISLKSSNRDATVSGTVKIAAGKTSATFTVKTKKVTDETMATISGTLNGNTQVATLTIQG